MGHNFTEGFSRQRIFSVAAKCLRIRGFWIHWVHSFWLIVSWKHANKHNLDCLLFQLFALGELCGLLPESDPSSEQLQLVLELTAGMGLEGWYW